MSRLNYARHERIVREAAALLRAKCPPSLPVVLRFYDRADDDDSGWCRRTKARFIVGIGRDPCPNCMLDTLFEEWAHARTWGAIQSHQRDHDHHFALEYWRCRREYYGIS